MAGNQSAAREAAYNAYKSLADNGGGKREVELAWGRYQAALATERDATDSNVAQASKRH